MNYPATLGVFEPIGEMAEQSGSILRGAWPVFWLLRGYLRPRNSAKVAVWAF